MSQATIAPATIKVDGDTVTATTYVPTATIYVDCTGKSFGWVLDSDLGSNSNIVARIVTKEDGSRVLRPEYHHLSYTANDSRLLPKETLASLKSLGGHSGRFKFTEAPMEDKGRILDEDEKPYLCKTVHNWPLTFSSKDPAVVAFFKRQMSTASGGAGASQSEDTAPSTGAEDGAE